MERPLCIWDLDETAIFTTFLHPLEGSVPCVKVFAGHYLHERPGLENALQTLEQHYDLAVWSAASEDYVDVVVETAFRPRLTRPLKFVWSRSRCSFKRDHDGEPINGIKPLKKLKRHGYSLERMIIIEDDPLKCILNYGNAIYVRPWLGDAEDTELSQLTTYLVSIAKRANFRTVDKRGWRHVRV